MTQSTCTSQRVSQLSALIQNPATVLPVFTRFHQASKQLTIPVVDVVINGDSVEVKGEDGAQHSINIELLQDIVVFRDGAGKPVFLTECLTGGDIVTEYLKEIEEGNRLETALRIKHQFIYLKKERKIRKPETKASVEQEIEYGIADMRGGAYEPLAA